MPTLIITVDLECCRCSTKIQKILCCIQEERCELVIEKVMYEKDKVIVSGPFDAYNLSCILRRKAGRIIKNIEIVKPPPPPPPPPPAEPKCKLICPYPYPCPPCPQPGGAWSSPCPTPGGAWSPPCSSHTPYRGCQSKPPPPPPKQPACQCPPAWSSCYCGGGGYPQCVPPPMPYCPVVVCDDSAAYDNCAVM